MPTTFETLPREIRDIIYEICLVCDGEIIPVPDKHQKEWSSHDTSTFVAIRGTAYVGVCKEARSELNMLSAGLLYTNHKLGAEAAEIFYGKNTFHLARIDQHRTQGLSFWTRYAHYLKHMDVRFGPHEVRPTEVLRYRYNTPAENKKAEKLLCHGGKGCHIRRGPRILHSLARTASLSSPPIASTSLHQDRSLETAQTCDSHARL